MLLPAAVIAAATTRWGARSSQRRRGRVALIAPLCTGLAISLFLALATAPPMTLRVTVGDHHGTARHDLGADRAGDEPFAACHPPKLLRRERNDTQHVLEPEIGDHRPGRRRDVRTDWSRPMSHQMPAITGGFEVVGFTDHRESSIPGRGRVAVITSWVSTSRTACWYEARSLSGTAAAAYGTATGSSPPRRLEPSSKPGRCRTPLASARTGLLRSGRR